MTSSKKWESFAADSYARANYLNRKYQCDKEIACAIYERYAQDKWGSRRFLNAVDVGTGPNLYPGLILSHLVDTQGTISLLEYSTANRQYLKSELVNPQSQWLNWEDLLKEIGFSNASISKLHMMAKIEFGSIFDLPVNTFDLVLSFFTACSISSRKADFFKAVASLCRSGTTHSVLIAAHILESRSYTDEETGIYPAANLKLNDVISAYSPYGEFTFTCIDDSADSFREGYKGIALVIGEIVDEALKIEC